MRRRPVFQICLRILEYLSAGGFAFVVLERCNLGGTANLLAWLAESPLLAAFEILTLTAVYALLRAFCRRPRIPFALYGLLVNLVGTANYFKLYFRNEPLTPYDVFNLGPATQIAGHMRLSPDPGLIFNLAFFLVCLLAFWLIPGKLYSPLGPGRPWLILPLVIPAAVWLIVFASASRLTALGFSDIRYHQLENYQNNGFVAATLMNLSDTGVKAPAGYSTEAMAALGEEIAASPAPSSLGRPPRKPHIIVLQMEAYSDPRRIEPRLRYPEDPFAPLAPRAAELRDFFTLTSVLGGGTSNTEYEFLTGNNLLFYPPGVTPFIRYVNGPRPSLARDLTALGYRAVVMHPNLGSFYNRQEVYPNLGFERLVTSEDFESPSFVGGFISDQDFGAKIIELYEEEKEAGPLFLLGISIQNHGPYSPPDRYRPYPLTLTGGLALSEIQHRELEVYGSNMRDANRMLAGLLDYFAAVDEPVLLLVFGDHQAAWSWTADFRAKYRAGLRVEPELLMRQYETESFFWANYPQEEDTRPVVSASGLGPELLLRAGLELPLYYKGIYLQFQELLAYNIAVMADNSGQVSFVDKERLAAYQMIQYDHMFGRRYLWGP